MPVFETTIQHNDKTFESLAHMQYDLFCKSNRVGRTILSIAAILLGIALCLLRVQGNHRDVQSCC